MRIEITTQDRTWSVPMAWQDDVYMQGSAWYGGWLLLDDSPEYVAAEQALDASNLQELFACWMYEGNERSGVYEGDDDGMPAFSWRCVDSK